MKFKAVDDINLRVEPSTSGKVIGKVLKDTVVLSDEYMWKAVTLPDGKKGYCAGSYLKEVKEVASSWHIPIRADKFKLTQKFLNPDPIYKKTGHHPGCDYGTQGLKDVPLYFCADGEVIESGVHTAFGNYFFFYVPSVDRTFVYFHLVGKAPAKGSYKAGTQCGIAGNTGLSEGIHLHLECIKGRKTSADRSVLFTSKTTLAQHAEDPDAFIRARLDGNTSLNAQMLYYGRMIKLILKKVLVVIAWSIVGLVILSSALNLYGYWYDEWSGYNASQYISDGVCNIAVISIHGEILAYENEYGTIDDDSESVSPEDVRRTLNLIKNDPNIDGVLFRIDSTGGSPAGSESIMQTVKDMEYPTVALIGDYGTSAGYLIATGADTIIASKFSDIGSIGITMSYLENTRQNEYDGLNYVPLASAPYKDYMNPNKPLTSAERILLERDLKIYHDAFVDMVALNRNLPREIIAEVADGASMPASLALEHKLVDSIGNVNTARSWLAERLKLPIEEVVLCE